MNKKLLRIAEERNRLIAKAASQRGTLALAVEPWRMPLARADQGLAALRYIKTHPLPIVGGIVLLALLRPGNAGKWLGRAFVAWRVLHGWRGRQRVSEIAG
jgi:hypothetical protein